MGNAPLLNLPLPLIKGKGIKGIGLDNLKVRCYSGYTYAERPVSFNWRGKDYEVVEIEKEWWGEGVKCFLVKTGDNKHCQLCYNENNDSWCIIEPAKEQ